MLSVSVIERSFVARWSHKINANHFFKKQMNPIHNQYSIKTSTMSPPPYKGSLTQVPGTPPNTAEDGCGNGFSLISALSLGNRSALHTDGAMRNNQVSPVVSSIWNRAFATRGNTDVTMVIQDVLDMLSDDEDQSDFPRGADENPPFLSQ